MADKDKATQLKEAGNLKFKQRSFHEAVKLYCQAEAAAPHEAVYSSNLSAALYELGDYASCLQAICRATNKLTEQEAQSSLSPRLSTRLAKTLSYGVREGKISADLIQSSAVVIEKLSTEGAKPSASDELVTAWKLWDKVDGEMDVVRKGAPDAQIRLSRLPMFKAAALMHQTGS
ncbi:hypothetical protein EUX98_g8683 [Antrodiella citrinella]|uniref:Uncharacterized protein n=1 Tax=Antrodiella citrinella TaxID=2447956 RepID=A0A4V3XG36_9APHY|nr:hypothetical protein EUX98_g8683 [Antrodiella citrinella]